MPPAVRLSDKAACPADKHGCPACPHPTFGPAVNGSTDVFINKLPAIRLDDPGIHMACCGPNQWQVAKGSPTVYVNNKPLARMGDKTKHCGGNGTLIVGSPNVFADDGALKGLSAVLAKIKDLLAGDAKEDSYDAKNDQKNGNWDAKTGKSGGGKSSKSGGGADGGKSGDKDGRGSQGGESGDGEDESALDTSDEDLSSDVEDDASAETGGILRVALDDDTRVFAPGQPVKFTVSFARDYEGGSVDVLLVDRVSEEEFRTSVTPGKKDRTSASGSIKAPELSKNEDGSLNGRELSLQAVKGEEAPVEAGDTIQVVGGDTLVLRLFEEDRDENDPEPSGDDPSNDRPDSTRPIEERVEAKVTIRTKSGADVQLDVVFEGGVAYVTPEPDEGPKAKWPKTEPADGEPYDPKVLAVEIQDSKYRDFAVKAFAPPTKSKKR